MADQGHPTCKTGSLQPQGICAVGTSVTPLQDIQQQGQLDAPIFNKTQDPLPQPEDLISTLVRS